MEKEGKVEEPDFDYAGQYTYADYLRWTIEERLELIRGKIFRMSAPNRVHQTISTGIVGPLWNYLKGRPCRVFSAPFDVRFPRKSKEDKDIVTVLQPDVCVVCDPEKLDHRGCNGAPDIVVEILSKGNNRKELQNKYEIYEEGGVQEYWVVSPETLTFLLYSQREGGLFQASKLMTTGEEVTTPLLPGFVLHLEELFAGVED